jgi:hypothetical protein
MPSSSEITAIFVRNPGSLAIDFIETVPEAGFWHL